MENNKEIEEREFKSFFKDLSDGNEARRSLAQPKGLVPTEHFGKCLVNFTRNSSNSNRTIADVCREYNEKENKRLGQNIK